MSAKISNLNMYFYGNPSGSFGLNTGKEIIQYSLDEQDCERIFAVLIQIAGERRLALAEAVLNMELPTLIGYDQAKTVDEVPF